MWLLITLIVFFIARAICTKVNTPLMNPLLLSVAFLIILLMVLNIPFPEYYGELIKTHGLNNIFQPKSISYLLQPAVVALAYPLYEQLPQIKANWRIIIFACTLGSALSMTTAMFIAMFFKADITLIASVLAKSVTTPIAMEVSRHLGGIPAVAAILVIIVGLFGAIFAYPVFNLIGIKHPIARGLTTGTISHALGTATCVEKNAEDAAFSSLALVLCGVITSILAPIFYSLALWISG